MPEYTRVTVLIKVLQKNEPVEVGGKTKQEVVVADDTCPLLEAQVL